ncbi:MAG: oxidoreductase [Pirellulaceae bacterium]|nr:oxidoreductase [Pirellulaceae bacterium]
MNVLQFPWLLGAVAVPLIGAAVVGRVRQVERAQYLTVIWMALTLAIAVGAWGEFALSGAVSASDPWLAGGTLVLGLDELSAPLLPLAALMYLLTTITTLRTKVRRFSFPLALVALALLLALLTAVQPWVQIALAVAIAVPPYWELRARNKPTGVFVFHMGLFAILLVGGWRLVETYGTEVVPWWVCLPLVVALLIRCGIAPLHCWITDLFEHATFGRALLVVTPMVGAYLAVRLLLPIAPPSVLQGVGFLALGTAVYAAGMSLVQTEARRFFCYIFISHAALVMVGLDTVRPIGLTGALCVWLSVGLSLLGFGLTLRLLEARHGRLSLARYHGLYEHTPMLAVCFFLTGMASVGFPGTFGFLGSELLVDGAVQSYPLVGVAVVIAAALNGIAVMKVYFLLFTGTRHVSSVPLGIGVRERFAVLAILSLILGGGILPQPGVVSRHHAAESILKQREARFPAATEPREWQEHALLGPLLQPDRRRE